MRFDDVDLPQAVVDAQRRGELVLFAGAGVSIDAPSNYPNFLDLAKELGGPAYPIHQHELIDRYLGRLEEHQIPVHERVKSRLSAPESRPNHLHESLVRLFGKGSALRIVTTNFDDHFRTAATALYGESPEVYRAPALPLGDDFTGIVHLHGSVRDEAKRLVLTDADFGRAYLTQGWARRFVQQLFSKFVVLFVGYSHQDLPLLYLARGISAAEDGPGRFALTSPTADTDWLNLGIKPIHYPLREAPLPAHSALGGCLAKWADTANLGSLETESRIRATVTSDRPPSIEDEDFLRQSLRELSTLRFFTRHARDPRWLEWVADEASFNAIFHDGVPLSEESQALALWFADCFAIGHFGIALEFVRRKKQTLSSQLWHLIAQAFHRYQTAGDALRFWVPVLVETMPPNGHADFLAYMITHSTVPDDRHAILELFRKLCEPRFELRRRFYPAEGNNPEVPDVEVAPIGQDYWMNHVYLSHLKPHPGVFGKGLALIVTSTFESARARFVLYGKAGEKWDPVSFSRGSVASRTQDHLHNGFSTLIDAGVDVLLWANQEDTRFASRLIGQWIESTAIILRRLAINGMTSHPLLSPDEKLSWIISNQLIEDVGLKNEAFALLAQVYGPSAEATRAELLARAEAVMRPDGEDYERYELFNLLSWLHRHAPDCALVTAKLHPIQERQPTWAVREHPDFNTWIGGGVRQLEEQTPVPATQIEEMNLAQLLEEVKHRATIRDMFGDSQKVGFLQGIAQSAATNFAWSEGIAREALELAEPPIEIWSALLRGWSGAHSPAEWTSVLAFVERLEPHYAVVLHELAALFKEGLEKSDNVLPGDVLDIAITRANSVLVACAAHEQPLPERSDNWVTEAINRTTGYLLEFYLTALRSLWPSRAHEQTRIEAILKSLAGAISTDTAAAAVARVLVASRAQLFAEMAPAWYTEHVLPLLEVQTVPLTSEQNWDGFLVWGSWNQDMLPGLIPAHLHHLPAITNASDERSRMFCGDLAGYAVFGAVDPIDSGWLDEFLTRASRRERMNWLGDVTSLLREANDQAKESAWERWLKRYIERRLQANPIALDSEECGSMCEWLIPLEAHYAELAELLLSGPAPQAKGNLFFYRLQEANLVAKAPALSARLLTALLSQEDGHELWDLDRAHMMASELIDLNPAEPALRPLCEQLGRLGSPDALLLLNRLR